MSESDTACQWFVSREISQELTGMGQGHSLWRNFFVYSLSRKVLKLYLDDEKHLGRFLSTWTGQIKLVKRMKMRIYIWGNERRRAWIALFLFVSLSVFFFFVVVVVVVVWARLSLALFSYSYIKFTVGGVIFHSSSPNLNITVQKKPSRTNSGCKKIPPQS